MYATQIDHMNLHQIANSGQCVRWHKIEDNSYKIPAFGRELTISQDGNMFILSCDENEWNSLWRNYFDLETNYNEVENIIMEGNDNFLKTAYEFGNGIRILRQDLWEVIISFIISQNNNIPRIKKSIEKICAEVDGRFPTCHEILDMDLSDKGLGYRDEYLIDAADWWIWEDECPLVEEPKTEFMKIKGVGEKVSNCICLFGMHQLDAFPVDTHIRKILDREYGGEMPDWAFEKYAGLFQQYIFYYSLNHKAL